MTMDNFCQYPVMTNIQRQNENTIFTSERRITSEILAETIKGLTLHSTINDSEYYNSDEYDAKIDPKSDPLLATHTSDGAKRKVTDTDTTNRNTPQKLLINQTLPIIIPPIDLPIADGVAAGRWTAHARQKIALKVIVTDAARVFSEILWR